MIPQVASVWQECGLTEVGGLQSNIINISSIIAAYFFPSKFGILKSTNKNN